MTALFVDAPIIIAGTTDTGMRYVQFWGDLKVQGTPRKVCMVSMSDGHVGGKGFEVDQDCPYEWLDLAWETYREFLAGVMPTPTHTVLYTYGKPEFRVIA